MDLQSIRDSYIEDGSSYELAVARTCRDVIVPLIANSRMADRVTVKGGVVMQQISRDCVVPRATSTSISFAAR